MVNAAQRGSYGFVMLVPHVEEDQEKTMPDDLKPDDSTIPAVTESGELNGFADEVGKASWKDNASSRPKAHYSYDVAET